MTSFAFLLDEPRKEFPRAERDWRRGLEGGGRGKEGGRGEREGRRGKGGREVGRGGRGGREEGGWEGGRRKRGEGKTEGRETVKDKVNKAKKLRHTLKGLLEV